jgi:GT2 family glycosyltransferase
MLLTATRPTAPDISIIIVNWNTRQLLLDCLDSLDAAIGAVSADVWVVDNASSDDSVAAVEAQFPQVRVMKNAQNLGFAAANNQAIRASSGRYVLLLNSDTIAHAGSVEKLVRFADRHPEVGIVGALLLNRDGSIQPSWAEFPTLWSELVGTNIRRRRPYGRSDGTTVYDVDWVGGACMLVRRAAIEQVGQMDQRYFMYSEEVDWCFRVRRRGWRICYLPAAQVTHLGGQSSRMVSTRMRAELYRSKLRFFAKHYGVRQSRTLGLLLQIGLLLKGLSAWLLSAARPPQRRDASARYYSTLALVSTIGQSWHGDGSTLADQ